MITYMCKIKNNLPNDVVELPISDCLKRSYNIGLLIADLIMDLIHYSFAPLILFRVLYTLDFLPYYLSIANGAGGVGIFELLVLQCFV